jgi:hypothetical protein
MLERVLGQNTLLARLAMGIRLADSFRALVRRITFPSDTPKGEINE